MSAKCSTCSPPSATTARWRPPAACSHPNAERYLRSPREMQELFRDLPEAIDNTLELSARLTYQMSDLGYRFPDYPVPEGETMQSFLEKRTEEGIRNRYLPKHDDKLWPVRRSRHSANWR